MADMSEFPFLVTGEFYFWKHWLKMLEIVSILRVHCSLHWVESEILWQ